MRRALALVLVCVVPALARAADPPLPPDAEKAFAKGQLAAEQQEWKLAIESFLAVQEKAPAHPPVLFNLGVAHGKAGFELPAIAWLHAYLASSPRAPNAEAVRKEIVRLEASAELKRDKIFRQAIAAVEEVERMRVQKEQAEPAWKRTGGLDLGIRDVLAIDFASGGDTTLAAKVVEPVRAWFETRKAGLGIDSPPTFPETELAAKVAMGWYCYGSLMELAGRREEVLQAGSNLAGTTSLLPDDYYATAIVQRNPTTGCTSYWSNRSDWAIARDRGLQRAAAARIADPARRQSMIDYIAGQERDEAKASPARLREWIRIARMLSEDDPSEYGRVVFHLEEAVREAASVSRDPVSGEPDRTVRPTALPHQIAQVGARWGTALVVLSNLDAVLQRKESKSATDPK